MYELRSTRRFMKPTYLVFDNLDDRREIFVLLTKLRPRQRWQFLRLSAQFCGSKPKPQILLDSNDTAMTLAAERGCEKSDDVVTNSVFRHLWHLAAQYELDMEATYCRVLGLVQGDLAFAELWGETKQNGKQQQHRDQTGRLAGAIQH